MVGVIIIGDLFYPSFYRNRHRMHFSRTIFLSLIVLVLAGCGAPAKKALPPPPIINVGVVSLLPSELSYQKFGITKFNNERASRPVGDVFNVAARAGAEKALRMAKDEKLSKLAQRTVYQLTVDVPKLANSVHSYPGNLDVKVEQIEEDLLALVDQHKLDAIVLVLESFEPGKPVNGIRVVLRAGLGYVDKAEAQPHLSIMVLDKKIKRLAMTEERSSFVVNRPGEAPWVYKLDENLLSSTHEHLTKMLQSAIEDAVEQGIMSLTF